MMAKEVSERVVEGHAVLDGQTPLFCLLGFLAICLLALMMVMYLLHTHHTFHIY